MLQFITSEKSTLSFPDQCRMVLNGGCIWIQLSGNEPGKNLRETIKDMVDVCKDTDGFLIIEHDVELVNELKVHGVHLFPGDMLPKEAREVLGPHAVIGVTVTTAAEVIALKSADIDYVHIGPFPTVSFDDYKSIVDEVRGAGVKIPIVATGKIRNVDLPLLIKCGVNGVAMSDSIIDSADPTGYVKEAIEILTSK